MKDSWSKIDKDFKKALPNPKISSNILLFGLSSNILLTLSLSFKNLKTSLNPTQYFSQAQL